MDPIFDRLLSVDVERTRRRLPERLRCLADVAWNWAWMLGLRQAQVPLTWTWVAIADAKRSAQFIWDALTPPVGIRAPGAVQPARKATATMTTSFTAQSVYM